MTNPDSWTLRADIKIFLVTVHTEVVNLFIKDVSGTHCSRLYILLSAPNGTGEPFFGFLSNSCNSSKVAMKSGAPLWGENCLPSHNPFRVLNKTFDFMPNQIGPDDLLIGNLEAKHKQIIIHYFQTPRILAEQIFIFAPEQLTE